MMYGVVDLARDPQGGLETSLARFAPDAVCLYREPIHENVRRCAPYLTPLDEDSAFARFWRETGWGAGWGIIIQSSRDLAAVQRHLRRLLTVELPQGRRALFRFYDPKVLPPYLRSCNNAELATWFSKVERFRVERHAPTTFTDFTFDGIRLIESEP